MPKYKRGQVLLPWLETRWSLPVGALFLRLPGRPAASRAPSRDPHDGRRTDAAYGDPARPVDR